MNDTPTSKDREADDPRTDDAPEDASGGAASDGSAPDGDPSNDDSADGDASKTGEPDLPAADKLPLMALRDKVLFPQMIIPLAASRPMSVQAVERALGRDDKTLVVVLQRDRTVERPLHDDLHRVGTRAVIKRMERGDDGLNILVQGVDRVEIVEIEADDSTASIEANVKMLPAPSDVGPDVDALDRSVRERVQQIQKLAEPQVAMGLQQLLQSVPEPRRLAYLLTAALSLKADEEQDLLETDTRREALEKINEYLFHESKVLELKSQIAGQVQSELTQRQREHVLREQMKAIQKELGEDGASDSEAAILRQKLEETKLPEDVRADLERELSRLERSNPAAPDYQVGRGYIEFALELPWNKSTEIALDLARAREILDEDHYGLDEVKERILEHLAVLKLNPKASAPILCFVGPPGTGKTSLGKSIARAIGRAFERMAVGGMHDESELRGHRRTYVGAMPGRILQAIRRAGVNNPLLMLDEVDKLGRDFRGDPAAALMEILDPSQNSTFRDNYLNLPFDLSKVFFICTANTLDTLPLPLLDRMELIEVDGYTDEEKLQIARRYLIPRRLKEAGLDSKQVEVDDDVLLQVIRGYTMEAGLRQLERMLGKLSRKVAYKFAVDDTVRDTGRVVLNITRVHEMLGPPWNRDERVRKRAPAGVCAGLAWTPTGGDVLYIEVALIPYNTGFTLTGQLGNVMKESGQAAMSYVLAMTRTLEIPRHVIGENGIHIHVPQGAIPKDGPSAGITIATAIASAYTGFPVRSDVAMTGEMTLTGLVLPIGGLKQKAMAAHRAGMKTIIVPEDNRKDLHEVPESVRDQVEFVFVRQVEDVWATAIPAIADRLVACRLDWVDPTDEEHVMTETEAEEEEEVEEEVRPSDAAQSQ